MQDLLSIIDAIKMNPLTAINYFKRIWTEVSQLSVKSGYNRFYHLLDYLSALLFHGAHIFQYTVGDLWRYSNPERSKRLTLYRLSRLFKKYNDRSYVHFFKNKPDFNRFFSDFIHRGWLYAREASFEEFKAFVTRYPCVIIKPVGGKEGIGIRKFAYAGENDDQLRQRFDALVAEDVIIEELIVQHELMNFGNASVNTVRALTVCRPDGEARVMKVILRAGVGDSLVDNTALGGYYYEVDVPTGIVVSKGINKDGELCIIHPGTDIVMLGFKVPKWDEVMQTCLEAARRMPQVAMVGWDVAITADGVQLIEGNDSADYQGYEFVGTSGFYEKIKAFMQNGQ